MRELGELVRLVRLELLSVLSSYYRYYHLCVVHATRFIIFLDLLNLLVTKTQFTLCSEHCGKRYKVCMCIYIKKWQKIQLRF